MEIGKSDLEALEQCLRSKNSPTYVFLGLLGIFEKKTILGVGRNSTGSNRLAWEYQHLMQMKEVLVDNSTLLILNQMCFGLWEDCILKNFLFPSLFPFLTFSALSSPLKNAEGIFSEKTSHHKQTKKAPHSVSIIWVYQKTLTTVWTYFQHLFSPWPDASLFQGLWILTWLLNIFGLKRAKKMQQEESVKVPCLNPAFERWNWNFEIWCTNFPNFFLASVPLSKFLLQLTLYKEWLLFRVKLYSNLLMHCCALSYTTVSK